MARADFLSNQRKQISSRLDELRPLYEEYLTLEKAQRALDELGAPVRRVVRNVRSTTSRGPGRPRTRRGPGRPATRRPRARRAGGTRRDQTLAQIKANPGITIPDLA